MKITITELRHLIQESLVGASKEYMEKEAIRQTLQDEAVDLIGTGKITNNEELTKFFEDVANHQEVDPTVKMAAITLKMVPFEVFKTLALQ